MSAAPVAIVVLISGTGTNLQALMRAVEDGRINGRICAVLSNRPGAGGLELARAAGLPGETLDHRGFESREAFDAALMERIDAHAPGLVVLAGFMRVFTEAFVRHYAGRLLNIHPSLLPAYRGLHTHERALADGVSEHGVSVHFVTPELDGGPVIAQARVPVHPQDSAELLAARVQAREHELYPRVVGWFCAGRLKLQGDQVQLDGEALTAPLQLDALPAAAGD
jgi:phosphoribosylglycinamide formyltransferase-1